MTEGPALEGFWVPSADQIPQILLIGFVSALVLRRCSTLAREQNTTMVAL